VEGTTMSRFENRKNKIIERKTYLQNKRTEIMSVLTRLNYSVLTEKGIKKVELCNQTIEKIDRELLSLRFDYLLTDAGEKFNQESEVAV
jgi:hypothetical protein